MGNKLYDILMSDDDVVSSIYNNLDYILSIIPEIKPMINFSHKHPQHNLDVFKHTLKALKYSKKDFEIRLALLFHDIGKPYSFIEGDIRHYPNHANVSEKITKIVLTRLNYNEELISNVCYLVKYHDTLITEDDVKENKEIQLKRYEVQKCDSLAHNPIYLDKRISYLRMIRKLIK